MPSADDASGRGTDRGRHLYGARQQLSDVDYLQRLLSLARALLRRDRVAEHHQAVRAAGGDGVRVGAEGLVDPLGVDPLADPLFHPHPGAAGTAAEAALLAPVHLLRLHARHLFHDLPRRGEDPVVPAQEARVVVGDLLLDRRDRREPPVGDELREQLSVVHHLVVAAQLRVLARDGVEAVRAAGHDLADARLVQRLDVLLGQHAVDELVAHPPGRVPGAGLGRAEHREVDPGGVQQLGDGLGGLLRPVLERARAADPEQVLDVVADPPVDDRHLEVKLADPVQALVLAHPPGIALVLQVLQHGRRFGRERGLDQHLMPAHVGDVVDVLDVDRALLDARAAVRAGP